MLKICTVSSRIQLNCIRVSGGNKNTWNIYSFRVSDWAVRAAYSYVINPFGFIWIRYGYSWPHGLLIDQGQWKFTNTLFIFRKLFGCGHLIFLKLLGFRARILRFLFSQLILGEGGGGGGGKKKPYTTCDSQSYPCQLFHDNLYKNNEKIKLHKITEKKKKNNWLPIKLWT